VRKGNKTCHQFWQKGGGYDRNITEPETLQKTIDYIHFNPVRRGLVERSIDWKWSSAGWFAEVGDSPLIMDRIPPEWMASD
jgi:putative transposase